ncbi:cbb3-type cytochrome c oxidase subunit 3 [Aliiroseovarius sp.]|uniref:cbb3-type cytochrome c oxidase subunit 3 n=1 Tax=Aliiroseovarius sp. TaxID=1872442 RepID=UPI003BAAB026
MDTYSIFREIADSWVLLAMFLFFLGVCAWAFRPGARETHKDIANIPFRHEDKPAGDGELPRAQH